MTIEESTFSNQRSGFRAQEPSSIFNNYYPIPSLTALFTPCYKEVLYVYGRRGQVVFPCCQAARNGYSDAAKLNPVWKWKRVRNSGVRPAQKVSVAGIRSWKDVPRHVVDSERS